MELVTLIRRLMGIQSTLGSEYFSDREGAYQYKGTYCENRRSSILLNAIDQQAIALALLFLVLFLLVTTSLRSSLLRRRTYCTGTYWYITCALYVPVPPASADTQQPAAAEGCKSKENEKNKETAKNSFLFSRMTKKKAGATFFVSDSYKDSVYTVTVVSFGNQVGREFGGNVIN